MDNLKKLVGKNIRKFRVAAGFKTQKALADAMDIDQPRVAKWESGHSIPDSKHRATLLSLLGVLETDLYGGIGAESDPPHTDDKDALIGQLVALLPALNESQIGGLLETAKAAALKNSPAKRNAR